MCEILELSKSIYYYQINKTPDGFIKTYQVSELI